MAGKAEEEDEDDEAEVRWRVTDGSSEAEVHPATNVLRPDRFRVWQTHHPCDEAWVVVEPRPATAFSRVEIVNAGSSLVEIYGWRDDAAGGEYELLLSPQQVAPTSLLECFFCFTLQCTRYFYPAPAFRVSWSRRVSQSSSSLILE